ncbi:hypothetical protein JB92DRAFT_3028849 [Gautieria morchelliformis]|nr:hypothetical protein JB92DRAFT_3028849 [Gautieria morchelliformis]
MVKVPPSMSVNLPLHARYPLPNASRHSTVRVPEPEAFWVCPTPTKSGTSTFSHLASPYAVPDAYHMYHDIQVPAGHHADVIFVEMGTVLGVVAAFFYVLWMVWMTATRMQRPNTKHE